MAVCNRQEGKVIASLIVRALRCSKHSHGMGIAFSKVHTLFSDGAWIGILTLMHVYESLLSRECIVSDIFRIITYDSINISVQTKDPIVVCYVPRSSVFPRACEVLDPAGKCDYSLPGSLQDMAGCLRTLQPTA